MIKTLSIENDAKDIFDLSQFAFQYQLSEADWNKKREEAKRHIIWGYMDEKRIAAKLHLIPLSINIGDKTYSMGGISSVATWPEYRRSGMVKELLSHALQYMKQNGQLISYLHPFSIPFYRKFGFELTFDEKMYKIPIKNLKQNWQGKGIVRRIEKDVSLLNELYSEYAKGFSGALRRDEKWWEQRVLKETMHIAVAFNEHRKAEGYLLFEVKEEVFTVHEFVYCSLNGRKLLLEFIANHDSMVDNVKVVAPKNDLLPLLLDDPRFEQKVDPYFMARIIDVFRFLSEYPFKEVDGNEVTLQVTDTFLPENNGIYHIRQQGLGTSVTYMKGQRDHSTSSIKCSIQQLTSVLLGYKRPIELYEIGLIQGTEEEVTKLDKLIPRQTPYFADFF